MPKDFYIKKIGQKGKIAVWLVDGVKIRRDLDEEFTNFGHHFRFKIIPQNEFWIDREAAPGERKYFIDSMLIMHKMQLAGKSHDKAVKAADKTERAEREKSKLFKRISSVRKHKKEVIEKIHKKLLGTGAGAIKIWVVRGELVRDLFFLDFTAGGHDLVYDFVSQNEVWIDDDVVREDLLYVVLHELYERLQMAEGLSYDDAHEKASKIEWEARHDAKKLEESLSSLGFNMV